MLVLFETPAGYALFKDSKEKRFEKVYNVISTFSERDSLGSTVQLDTFTEFKDTKEALVSTNRLIDNLLPKTFDKFLNTNPISQDAQSTLMTYGKDVSSAVEAELDIASIQDKKMEVLSKGVEFQLNSLIEGLKDTENKGATLSLANGLSRYKLMFSTEKVDIMIIQAVSLLEDLDREIVRYTMRLKEWYGWHFPELDKIVTDNVLYARAVKAVGIRTNCHGSRFCEFLSEDIDAEVREAIELSMGNEITLKDEEFICNLAGQVIELDEYRVSLTQYLKTRMLAIAPNLTQIVGVLVGAKLIAQAGSLISLAKYPSSTIQILGAEKALLKAIKTNQNTPKYGLIYQASLIEQSSDKIKGKLSRTLAAKCSVCIRVDALGESENGSVGQECKEYLEGRLQYLESTLHQHERGHNHKKHHRPHAHQQHQQHWIKEKEHNRKYSFSKEFVPNHGRQFIPGLNKKRNINEHVGFEYNDRNRFGKKKRKHFEG